MKSHVSIEKKQCPICLVTHDKDCGVLLDKELKNTLEKETVTGFSFCESCQELKDQDYVALIELKSSPSKDELNVRESCHLRTGVIAHSPRLALKSILNIPIPEDDIMFVQLGVIQQIQQIQ